MEALCQPFLLHGWICKHDQHKAAYKIFTAHQSAFSRRYTEGKHTHTGAWLMHNQSCVQMQPTAMWKGSLSHHMKVFSHSVCHNTPNHCCQESNSLFLPFHRLPVGGIWAETSCTGYLVVGIIKEPFDMKNVHFCVTFCGLWSEL